MANLDNVLQQLREEHKQAQGAVEKLRQAISTIESLNGNSAGTTVTVLGQRKQCQQRQGEKLLMPKEPDGRRSESNLQRPTPNAPTRDHEEFQPKVESESLRQQEQDGRE
jgi:hypothetical protein